MLDKHTQSDKFNYIFRRVNLIFYTPHHSTLHYYQSCCINFLALNLGIKCDFAFSGESNLRNKAKAGGKETQSTETGSKPNN